MNSTFAKYREQLKRLSSEFTAGQKAVVILAVLAVVAGSFIFSHWSTSTANTILYTNLAPEDASAITSELQGRNVTYSLSDNGASISVPKGQAAQLRIDLAAKSLPSSGSKGWSIIDGEGMTTSEFRQRIDYQRALEGELQKTIEALDPVSAAMVRLVVPRNDVFAGDNQKPTASVLIIPKSGGTLSNSQVQAIVNLTAGAVPGLVADDVTVTDSSGRLLAAPGMEGASSAGLDGSAGATAQYESKVAGGVMELLAPVFGLGNVHVKVAATLNYDKKQTVSEQVQAPTPPVLTSEKTNTETLTGNGTVGGVLGPTGTTLTANGTGNNYNLQAVDRQYAVGKITQTVQAAPGTVEQMSIAVVLDQTAAKGTNLGQIQTLVAAATGLNAQRGDSVQISRLPFDKTNIKEAEAQRAAQAGDQSQAQIIDLVRNVLVWVGIGILLLLIMRSLRRARLTQLATATQPVPTIKTTQLTSPVPDMGPPQTSRALEEARIEEQVRSSSEVLRTAPSSDVAAIMRAWAQEG